MILFSWRAGNGEERETSRGMKGGICLNSNRGMLEDSRSMSLRGRKKVVTIVVDIACIHVKEENGYLSTL